MVKTRLQGTRTQRQVEKFLTKTVIDMKARAMELGIGKTIAEKDIKGLTQTEEGDDNEDTEDSEDLEEDCSSDSDDNSSCDSSDS
jgi:hypothetical protein